MYNLTINLSISRLLFHFSIFPHNPSPWFFPLPFFSLSFFLLFPPPRYWFCPPPTTGAAAAAACDGDLDAFMHLWCLNRGILLTPFHNMVLLSPFHTYQVRWWW